MNVTLHIGPQPFQIDTDRALSLAKYLDFESSRVAFGAGPPHRESVRIGDFVGDTRRGGGCNVDQLSLIPHCHGTHTESIGHIVNEHTTIAEVELPTWMIGAMLTVTAQAAEGTDEDYRPAAVPGDLLITAAELAASRQRLTAALDRPVLDAFRTEPVKALIVRCQPHDKTPRTAPQLPPYFSTAAIRWCNDQGIRHLLVESPSIDRLEDEGQLTNHHAYWNVPAGTHVLTAESWEDKTITESIKIDPSTPDGVYLLNLQVPAFGSDAAPSKPVIFPLELEGSGLGEVLK